MKSWEIAGWLLLLLGLYLFYQVFGLLVSDPPHVIASGPLMVFAIFIFRGGIRLLEVGAAAHACRELQAPPSEAKAGVVPPGRRV